VVAVKAVIVVSMNGYTYVEWIGYSHLSGLDL